MFLLGLFINLIKSGTNFTDGPFTYTILSGNNEAQIINIINIDNITITIPEYVNHSNTQYSVVSIYSQAFQSNIPIFCSYLYFPSSLREIEEGAFANFPSLRQIGYITNDGNLIKDELPPNVTEINDKIFCNCTNLRKFKFKFIFYFSKVGDYAFCNCSSLESFEASLNTYSIGIGSFANCTKLSNFNFNQVYKIDICAFQNCYSIQKVDMSKTFIKKIENETFFGCSGITELVLPNTIEEIGTMSFFSCNGITELALPNSIKEIGVMAFFSCINIISLHLNKSIDIRDFAFSGCSNLVNVVSRYAPYYIGQKAFYKCDKLKLFHVSNKSSSMTYIGEKAFYLCKNLTDFDFDKMPIYYIGDKAFYSCPLQSTIVFSTNNMYDELQIGSFAFYSNKIYTIDFGTPQTSPFSLSFSFKMNHTSFICPSLKCVMVSENYYEAISSSFTKIIVNGKKCPNYVKEDSHIGIIVGVIFAILAFSIAFTALLYYIKDKCFDEWLISTYTRHLLDTVQPNYNNERKNSTININENN